MKKNVIFILIVLFSVQISEIKAQENDYGTIQVLYIFRINQQLLQALQNTDNWALKTYDHACLSSADGLISDTLNRHCKKKIPYTLSQLRDYGPDSKRTCTRFYEGSGKICDAKLYAEKDKVFTEIAKVNKSLSYMITDEKNYVIQYKEGNQNKLQFEIAVGEDYVIALFHEDEKIFWAGNMQHIQTNKSWKMFNPQGPYPYKLSDEGYFKVKTRITFD
jgi:hypothetical protein